MNHLFKNCLSLLPESRCSSLKLIILAFKGLSIYGINSQSLTIANAIELYFILDMIENLINASTSYAEKLDPQIFSK